MVFLKQNRLYRPIYLRWQLTFFTIIFIFDVQSNVGLRTKNMGFSHSAGTVRSLRLR
jgi:hypothetical protein